MGRNFFDLQHLLVYNEASWNSSRLELLTVFVLKRNRFGRRVIDKFFGKKDKVFMMKSNRDFSFAIKCITIYSDWLPATELFILGCRNSGRFSERQINMHPDGPIITFLSRRKKNTTLSCIMCSNSIWGDPTSHILLLYYMLQYIFCASPRRLCVWIRRPRGITWRRENSFSFSINSNSLLEIIVALKTASVN